MNWEIFLSWQFGMTLVAGALIGWGQYLPITRRGAQRAAHGHVSHPPAESGPPGDDTPPPR
jgi:hypothetical protein